MEKILKCWEVFKCEKKECPAYKSKNLRCWLFSGTHCRNEIQGNFLEKMEMCLSCEVFKANMDIAAMEETIKVVDTQFKEFRQIVADRDKELEGMGMELALGLSEAFEALKKTSSGDPTVRIPETSGVELISKLKHMINLTAKDIGEMVNQSHEFAIGLAEHFDVLHRVSMGDLNARVSGSSQVELLESLKKVINQTIESISSEISERKRAEEALRKAHDELEIRVEERTAELTVVNKELEAFSYSVSHDLRAPLRAIDGFSHVLLEDYSHQLDEEGKRVLNIIRDNAQKMGQLIDDLLTFSRTGRQQMTTSDIDMGKLVKVVFEELKYSASKRILQLNFKELPYAHGDQAMIRQVFVNLLSNAIKFTRPGKTAIIEVAGWNEGNENIYYVRDNGVGFDMQYVNKLFGVFQRLHSTEEFDGTGVGLAIVQRIIHRHGGRVWAEGKINEGATFYFSLPISHQQSAISTQQKTE